ARLAMTTYSVAPERIRPRAIASRRLALLGEAAAQRGEDRLEHRRGEAAGIGVVARAVIAVGEHQAARQRMDRAMLEAIGRAAMAECREHRLMRDRAQRQH